ncbi:TRAM domain-containing protein [Candidatus Daviesbacteria bacterium]|nr:TRAM domain-containing protein [Candidatus Daviesbacteria bacterium]
MATIFATFAVIFSELVPPVEGANPTVVKTFITVMAWIVGFVLFSDIAASVTKFTLHAFNLIVARVASEVLNQFVRINPTSNNYSFGTTTSPTGTIAITKPLIVDTSAIIDARILDIAKAGFVSGLVLIPQFVLTELQQVADSSDELKRMRGRKGFEVIEDLKKLKSLRVEIWDKEVAAKQVDDKLLKLAKSLSGKIITTDFNLNRLASISGVSVLNVNDLANAVKTIAIPGEKISIKIVHIGKDQNQGVGYLQDGTMVVVSDSADNIGKTVQVEVTKSLQIPAGRMVFARKLTE